MGARLKPDQRDRILGLVDLLVAGSVLLRGRLILQGRVVVVADELFAAVASEDRLPSTVGDMLQALYQTPEPPRTYGQAAKMVLLSHGAVQTRRAEEAELDDMARAEAHAEARKIASKAKADAQAAKDKAARREARERKALKAAA